MRGIATALLALATVAYSHGNHDQDTSVETDWATRHMKGMSVYFLLVALSPLILENSYISKNHANDNALRGTPR